MSDFKVFSGAAVACYDEDDDGDDNKDLLYNTVTRTSLLGCYKQNVPASTACDHTCGLKYNQIKDNNNNAFVT